MGIAKGREGRKERVQSKTYRSSRKRQNGITLHRKVVRRQNRVRGGVEVVAAGVLEQIGVSVDERVDTGLVEAGGSVMAWSVGITT